MFKQIITKWESTHTFYFDPGKYSSNNPVVPNYLYDTIYPKYGEYFAKAMSGIGSMYFTKEAFDKLYPGIWIQLY